MPKDGIWLGTKAADTLPKRELTVAGPRNPPESGKAAATMLLCEEGAAAVVRGFAEAGNGVVGTLVGAGPM